MRAGLLDCRVVIERKTSPQDGTGEEVDAWAPAIATGDHAVWMGKRDVRAAERFAAQQTVAEIDTVFTARWAPGFEEIQPDTHRLVYRGRIYNIHGVTEIGRRNKIEIACAARGEAAFR
ncbi:phage head closure protein [Inquilinus sp.]|jgi:SPP1 family predicted phage head-tail adaptor|uniref:phage head closure protein n=1 Tax=Inquilinus sp. TaxID=1932117 RepID=UPI00378355A3